MRRFVQFHLSSSSSSTQTTSQEEEAERKRSLMQHNIVKYEQVAERLLASQNTTNTNNHKTPTQPTARINPPILHHGITSTTSPTRAKLDRLAEQASAQLKHALDLDESSTTERNDRMPEIQAAYIQAAELHLQALRCAKEEQQHFAATNRHSAAQEEVIATMKRRLESILDRIEKLKKQQQSQSQRQIHGHPGGTATTKQVLRQPSENNHQQQPQSLTAEEVDILTESSTTVSGLFLPWSDDDAEELCQQATRTIQQPRQHARFTDPKGPLRQSVKQQAVFWKWARPDEIVQIRHQQQTGRRRHHRSAQPQTPVLIQPTTGLSPYTIQQEYVTDCSFIASLCVTAALERRLGQPLITSSLYPQQKQEPDGRQRPVYNPLGKYMVKLWLNGVARCVVIDDYLPIDQYGNLLCSHSTPTTAPQYLELWVCFMEKAYLKLCGGYDFPGSNSGVDLFSLTGWIPERVHFSKQLNMNNTTSTNENNMDETAKQPRDFEMLPERAWERIVSASSFGDCVMTVSSHLSRTDAASQAAADRLGLVLGHAYAVLRVVETSRGVRLLQLKNPWALQGWKGRYSALDTEAWKDATLCAELEYHPEQARRMQDDGVFWICWEDILQYFQNFHLSWNPFLFRYRTTLHGRWPKTQGPYDDTFNVGDNPQYIVTLSDEAICRATSNRKVSIWILISRHVSKQEQEGAEVSDFLTVHIHRNQGQKETIWYPGKSGNCVLTGAYTNNPHVLVRYDATTAEDKHLSLVLSQYQKSNDLRYTLSVYSTESFVLSKPRPTLPHRLHRQGHFRLNGGGPLGSQQQFQNPMYSLTIAEPNTMLELRVATAKNTAVNVVVLPVARAGQGLNQAIGRAVLDSGKYRHGFLVADRTMVPVGTYVLMVSRYIPKQEGPFELVCLSSQAVQLEAIQTTQ